MGIMIITVDRWKWSGYVLRIILKGIKLWQHHRFSLLRPAFVISFGAGYLAAWFAMDWAALFIIETLERY